MGRADCYRRPGEGRDPYRVIYRECRSADAVRKPKPVVMGPRLRGGDGPMGRSTSNMPIQLAARIAPEFYKNSRPKRAWGMPGARCTRSLVRALVVRDAHEYSQRSHRKSPGIPARNGFTAYGVLSPATNSSCHRRRRIDDMSETRLGRQVFADLTPATGARTTRFDRPQHCRSSRAPLSIAHEFCPPCDLMRTRHRRVHRIPPHVS
jgi:hypothetical protein